MKRTLLAAAACAAATVLSACGSTVEQGYGAGSANGGLGGADSTVSGGSGSSDGTVAGGPSTDGSGSTPGASGGAQGGSSGGSAGSSGSGSGTSGGARSGTSGSTAQNGTTKAGNAATTGVGVTATTISIGVVYTKNADSANSAIGANGITGGDDMGNFNALVDTANEAGGINGRKIVPVFYGYDAQSTSSGAAQDSAACAKFTQDTKVMVVIGGSLTDTLPACLKKAGIFQVVTGFIINDDKGLQATYPSNFLLGAPTQDRALSDLLSSFKRQGYYGGWDTVNGVSSAAVPVKTGVISYDPPQFKRPVGSVLVPGLSQAGHAPASQDVLFVQKPASQSDVSSLVAQIQSATLKLQQDGVTHVVLNDASGLILGLFGTNAKNQGYFPRIGLTSGAGPQAIKDAGLVTAAQLNGMAGLGWLPTLDVPAADGSTYATDATRQCLQIMKDKTGQTYTSTNAASIALGACDAMFTVEQALSTTTDLTPSGLVKSIENIGRTGKSPLLPQSFYSPTHHDSAVRGFDLNFDSGCSCVKYSSPHDIP